MHVLMPTQPGESNVNHVEPAAIDALSILSVPTGGLATFVTEIVATMPPDPAGTVGNVASATEITALVPLPLTITDFVNAPGASLAMSRVAERAPGALGSNTTRASTNPPG